MYADGCLDVFQLPRQSEKLHIDSMCYNTMATENKEQELSVGDYELAFLANLVASYLFENSKNF